MAEPRHGSTPTQAPFGNAGDSYTYTREFPTTIWPHAEAVDFYGPDVDMNAAYENERWMAEQFGRPMHTIKEMRTMSDQSRATRDAAAQAARERVAALPYDVGTKRTGSVGAGVETGFINGVAGALDTGTYSLYSPVIERYRDEALANSHRRASRADVVPNPYVDTVVSNAISIPGGAYLAALGPYAGFSSTAKKYWNP
jgi:hypothetical protein